MALNQFFGKNTGMTFQIVDVLGKVSQQLPRVLEQSNECMGWRESVGGRKDILCHRIENGGVFSEDTNVEDFLRVAQPEMLQLRIESSLFGPEVGDP